MAKVPHEAPTEVYEQFKYIRELYHHKRLENAEIVIFFNDDKPFKKNRFNWGKVKKCSPETRALVDSSPKQHNFFVTIPLEGWNYLDTNQRNGWVDLLLTRCSVEYEPETEKTDDDSTKKKKPKKVKDALGRVKFTDQVKFDEDGNPKWIVEPLDLQTITDNVSRYGAWFPDFKEFGDALKDSTNRQAS